MRAPFNLTDALSLDLHGGCNHSFNTGSMHTSAGAAAYSLRHRVSNLLTYRRLTNKPGNPHPTLGLGGHALVMPALDAAERIGPVVFTNWKG